MEPEKMSDASEKQNADVTLNSEVVSDKSECALEEKKEEQVLTNNEKPEEQQTSNQEDELVDNILKNFPKKKDEIVAVLEKLIDLPVEKVKEEVNQLKVAFYSIRKQEIEKEKEAFLEKGNEESAFAPMMDPEEEKLKDLLKQYKEKRSEYLAALDATRKENLQSKQDCLAKLTEVIEDVDNIGRNYNKFQQLQQDFKNIGEVPAENVTQLWKSYQQLTERFYDLLKINKELRDYDFKKNLEAKEALCEAAEELDKEEDVVQAFKKLQMLHDQWREIGPVAQEIREEIWQRFKAASTLVNKKHQSFFEQRKESEKENEDAKIDICEKIEAMKFDELKTYVAWDEATEAIKALQEDWKKLGFASRKANVTLFARFRKSCDDFFALKAAYFKSMKEEANSNLQKKIALCEKAESLKDSTDWKKTTNELIALQKEWKTVGPVSKKHSDAVWKRFLSACDYFFEQKGKLTTNIHKEEHENLEKKKSITAELEAMLEAEAVEDAAAKVKELAKQWREVGHVPFKEKDKVYNEFQTVLKKAYDKFDIKEIKAKLSTFENNVEQLGNDSDKLLKERDRLMRTFEQKRGELKTYENNMSFFTVKSKAGNSMLKEMERKISRIQEDLSVLEKKIELIDSKL